MLLSHLHSPISFYSENRNHPLMQVLLPIVSNTIKYYLLKQNNEMLREPHSYNFDYSLYFIIVIFAINFWLLLTLFYFISVLAIVGNDQWSFLVISEDYVCVFCLTRVNCVQDRCCPHCMIIEAHCVNFMNFIIILNFKYLHFYIYTAHCCSHPLEY